MLLNEFSLFVKEEENLLFHQLISVEAFAFCELNELFKLNDARSLSSAAVMHILNRCRSLYSDLTQDFISY